MSLSKRHLSRHTDALDFDIDVFASALKSECPGILFALLMGSSKDGHVEPGSDIDIAVYIDDAGSFDVYLRVIDVIERFAPGVHIDVGSLREAEPVYRFEALKGRLLFTRDLEAYVSFFSLSCREYESQMLDYHRQLRYRTGAA